MFKRKSEIEKLKKTLAEYEKLMDEEEQKKVPIPERAIKKSKLVQFEEDDKTIVFNIIERKPIKGIISFNTKFDAYILYIKKSGNAKLLKVLNLDYIYKNFKQAWIISNFLCYIDNKPLFMIKEGIAITPKIIKSTVKDDKGNDVIEGYDLCYDPKEFLVMLDNVTLSNLSARGTFREDLKNFLEKNFYIILIAIVVGIIGGVFVLTPYGQSLIKGFIEGFKP